jgi:hypothetical protein
VGAFPPQRRALPAKRYNLILPRPPCLPIYGDQAGCGAPLLSTPTAASLSHNLEMVLWLTLNDPDPGVAERLPLAEAAHRA